MAHSALSSIEDIIEDTSRCHLHRQEYNEGRCEPASHILQDLHVHDMRLLTSSVGKLAALEGFGLSGSGRVPIPDTERPSMKWDKTDLDYGSNPRPRML